MNNDISNLKNITVLYVEDEKDLREVTSSILQSFTKNQYIAANGQEGYELFLKHIYQLQYQLLLVGTLCLKKLLLQ